jgi:hypothetical protein
VSRLIGNGQHLCFLRIPLNIRRLSHSILHDPTIVPQLKPGRPILRPIFTLHLHSQSIVTRLQTRSTSSHKASRKLREH